MGQQPLAVQAPAYNQNAFGGISGYGMEGYARPTYQGVGMLKAAPMSEVAHGKQQSQEGVPEFDEAAFERAFEQAQQDMIVEVTANTSTDNDQARLQDYEAQLRMLEQQNKKRLAMARQEQDSMIVTETDPVLLRIREKRLRESKLYLYNPRTNR